MCLQYSVRDTSALRDSPLLRAAGVFYHATLHILLCRFCGYLIDLGGLGHVYQHHNHELQACLDRDKRLRDIVLRLGSRYDSEVLVAAVSKDIIHLCGEEHGWEEVGVEEAKGEQQQQQLTRRPKKPPLSIDDCAQQFRDSAAAGKPKPPIPLLPLYQGRWCDEHNKACVSAESIREHVHEHIKASPGFNEESMELVYLVKLSMRPNKHDEHTVRVRGDWVDGPIEGRGLLVL